MTARPPVDVRVPGDKSMTHRALILAALADGESRLAGLLDAADTRATRDALRALGVPLAPGPLAAMTVPGVGAGGLRTPSEALDCGNSGTTARLLLGLLAGCDGLEAVLTGDASLRRRPMRRVTEPLRGSGAVYRELGEPGRLPIRVAGRGALQPIDVASPRASAQVKSALLLAGLAAGTPVTVREPGRSRDHTERMLRGMGAPVESRAERGGTRVTLDAPVRLGPMAFEVPGDASSAAFFLGLGALRGPVRVRGVGLNPTRTGALRVLERMGAGVSTAPMEERLGEPVGDVTVLPGPLRGTTVTADEVPGLLDEIPLLAAIAARAEGETRFEGVAELRVKESDRIRALEAGMAALGVETRSDPGSLVVVGRPGPLRGTVDSAGDHRIAMAFGVLAAAGRGEVQIRGRGDARVSYPDFWKDLERLKTKLEAA